MISAISPIDGRYAAKTAELKKYFSEEALIRYRCRIEIAYFKALLAVKDLQLLRDFPAEKVSDLTAISSGFTSADAAAVKGIEANTNHDVKAVEYFIKQKFEDLSLQAYAEFIHFGLTSQDINNTANPLMIKDALEVVLLPQLLALTETLDRLSSSWWKITMLARTHGQPASPTSLGKEIKVFVERLTGQIKSLESFQIHAKFGGATGNFNAHQVAYPEVDWEDFANQFVSSLGLVRHRYTTQIAHYDDLAELFHLFSRTNVILIDLCRDIWTYISQNYFRQKTVAGEVGSSTMPHKVNPIDFENAEGNLGLANALFIHLAEKLPISRLQRDLTDSTVLRNTGIPFAHTLLAIKSLQKGLAKLEINERVINADLEDNWAVLAEAYQTVMRSEGIPNSYEALKDFTRGKDSITKSDMLEFIETLDLSEEKKAYLRNITPQNYRGIF